MSRARLIILLLVIVVMIGAGGTTAWLLMHHDPAVTASADTASDKGEHHGVSPAIWVALFAGVWVPLIAGAARRKRAKKALQGRRL